jgi:Transposase IS66 family
VERACPGLDAGASDEVRAEALALRATARRDQSAAALVAAIRTWALRQHALPDSALGKAIAYMLGLWTGLTRLFDDSRIALDNNATERALRGMVLGRKNHYGSRSKSGTEVATLFYSLIESAKLCGVEPNVPALRHPGGARDSRCRHAPARASDALTAAHPPSTRRSAIGEGRVGTSIRR